MCNKYTRPRGVMGGPCLTCGRPQPEHTEPTKQREGDQPLPIKNEHPIIQDLVQADIEARKQIGISRYGTALQPFNSRDVLRDIYEELLDAAVYMRQALYERDGK